MYVIDYNNKASFLQEPQGTWCDQLTQGVINQNSEKAHVCIKCAFVHYVIDYLDKLSIKSITLLLSKLSFT